MKKNALILSAFFGLAILCSTPQTQAITINKKYLAVGVAVLVLILATISKKKGGHSHGACDSCKPGYTYNAKTDTCERNC